MATARVAATGSTWPPPWRTGLVSLSQHPPVPAGCDSGLLCLSHQGAPWLALSTRCTPTDASQGPTLSSSGNGRHEASAQGVSKTPRGGHACRATLAQPQSPRWDALLCFEEATATPPEAPDAGGEAPALTGSFPLAQPEPAPGVCCKDHQTEKPTACPPPSRRSEGVPTAPGPSQ